MSYSVKSIYYTIQGEGARTGRPAVFCRFAGCNLWSGHERDRNDAPCWFCDTDFAGTDGPGGGQFKTPQELADHITSLWPDVSKSPYVVFTGGEPTLQLDSDLIARLKEKGCEIAIETNGTRPVQQGVDWITVSPKPGGDLQQTTGSELKLVYPQELTPESVEHLLFDHYYLSPLVSEDEAETHKHISLAAEYCKSHPKWCLTYQMHKFWGID